MTSSVEPKLFMLEIATVDRPFFKPRTRRYSPMKKIPKIIPALVLLSGLSIGAVQNVQAQQMQPSGQNVKKEHLEYCVSQLTVQVAQIQAIEAVKKQPNLTPVQKLEQISQMLTPEQKEQLMACMQQPMPAPAP
jgi:Spy/CpxP family protein refolding chaperone